VDGSITFAAFCFLAALGMAVAMLVRRSKQIDHGM
jgi:hypothetical protein